MTPAARHAAAIQVLDLINSGDSPEKALKDWARGHRFAGSGDRAAIRDICFSVLRKRRSAAALGGGETGRDLVLGLLRDAGVDPDLFFTGATYAPPALSDAERIAPAALDGAVAADCPDWLWPIAQASLGENSQTVFNTLRDRAPLVLRVNLRKTTRAKAISALADHGIIGVENPVSETAITLPDHPRNLKNLPPYLDGLVELQDAASQAIVDLLSLSDGMRVLDYCAGGGGKTLAMAGKVQANFFAHDANPQRMKDLPSRAARAGVKVELLGDALVHEQKFDLVLCDAPCSGSGSWRRDPTGKWALTAQGLADLTQLQGEILQDASALVAEGGYLAYATCSFLSVENNEQVINFTKKNDRWELVSQSQLLPNEHGDGFFIALLKCRN